MNKSKKTVILLIVATLILIVPIIIYYQLNKDRLQTITNNLKLTIEDVEPYEYDENALNGKEIVGEEGVSNLSDLKDYLGGYELYVSELKPIMDYFDLDIVYFVVGYSTTSKDSYLTIGIREEDKKSLTDEKIKKFVKWVENNESLYYGHNDLKYKGLSIDVYKKYEKEINVNNFSKKVNNDMNYLTNKDMTMLINTDKKSDTLLITDLVRLTKDEIKDIQSLKQTNEFVYELGDSFIDNKKTTLSTTLFVNEDEFNKLGTDEKIKFVYDEFNLYKEMNSTLIALSLMIIDKESGEILFKTENAYDFFESNKKIKK